MLLHAWGESRQSFDRLVCAVARRRPRDRAGPTRPRRRREARVRATRWRRRRRRGGVPRRARIESAVLVGSSSGGYVAQQVAVSRPDRVTGLVLLGSPRSLQERAVVRGRGRPAEGPGLRRVGPRVARLVPAAPAGSAVVPRRPGPRRCPGPGPCLACGLPRPGRRHAAHGPGHDHGPHAPHLWRARRPRGRRPGGHCRRDPDARTVGYEGTGHLVLWEQPGRIAADLVRFLEQVLGPDLPTVPPPA